MTKQPIRLHVVVAAPWKDAVLAVLTKDPGRRAWPQVPDARPADRVVLLLDTEPKLAFTQVLHVGADGGIDDAVRGLSLYFLDAVPVGCLHPQLWDTHQHVLIDGILALDVASSLSEHQFVKHGQRKFGHSSMSAALALLGSRGCCTGCGTRFLEPDQVSVRTVDEASGDWPAALCASCQSAMHAGGFDTFLDYRFSRHPACPVCGGRRTQRAIFGYLPDYEFAPWEDGRGCCVDHDIWTCTLCAWTWGPPTPGVGH